MSDMAQGSTDVSRYVLLIDAISGEPATGVDPTDMTLSYVLTRAAPVTSAAAALVAVTSAHADNSAIEVDATNCPGLYRIDWPDAAFFSAGLTLLVVIGPDVHPAVEALRIVEASAFPTISGIADAVWDEAIAGHAAAGSTGESLTNGANVTIYPFAASTPGGIDGTTITLYQHAAAPSFTITVTDALDVARDLSAMTLRFIATTLIKPYTEIFEILAADIVVGGASNNQATVTYAAADTAAAGHYRWEMWDDDADELIAWGPLIIEDTLNETPVP